MSDFKESELYRINEILKEFDFERVRQCMVGMGWTWVNAKSYDGTPSVAEMKEQALRLLEWIVIDYIRKKQTGYVGTGGFEVEYSHEDDVIEMKFVVTQWNDIHATEEKLYQQILKKEKRLGTINKLLKNGK